MDAGVSMESFGPVSPDYFSGRRVVDVHDGDGAEGSPQWTIVFDGGGVIHNFDPMLPRPTTIKGAALSLVVLGGKVNGVPVTELRFGLESIILNALEYAIADPVYTKGQLVYAQRSEANMPSTTPEHPDERVAEGPEEVDESE